VRLVMAESLRLTLIGCGAGLLVVLAFVRPMGRLLYGVGLADPVALGGGLALVAAVAVLAGLQPTRRASRLDPLVALRGLTRAGGSRSREPSRLAAVYLG
jgi:putative ABC transport system permease protein